MHTPLSISVIFDVSSARRPLPLLPREPTFCCITISVAPGQERTQALRQKGRVRGCSNPHAERFRNVPERRNRGISLAQFQSADVGGRETVFGSTAIPAALSRVSLKDQADLAVIQRLHPVLNTISTRRLICRPSASSEPSGFVLGTLGRVAPKPRVANCVAVSRSRSTSHLRTDSARRSDSF